jgi:hypothetical protein
VLEAATYALTLALFGFVIFATVWVKDDMLILACIPPVFLAAIVGFIMWIYAFETFGPAVPVVSILVPLTAARLLSRRYSARDLVIAIYLAWTVGMVCALYAFSFPDTEG